MSEPAGFDILQTLIPFDSTYSFGRSFIVGVLNTLLVSALGIVFATILGFTIGIAYIILTVAFVLTISLVVLFFLHVPLHRAMRLAEE